MKRSLAIALALLAIGALAVFAGRAQTASAKPAAGSLVGTGATFPFPLISKWIPAVESALGIKITYSATGSGAGIAQITARTVDFGASDAPLSPDQLTACKGCVVIPWALAGMSVPYNLPSVGKRLVLNGPVLANIYLGNITNWNAAAIKALNPGVNLPDQKITVVYRSDGSGSTYAFTNYLATVSPQWKSKVGVNTSVNFPVGTWRARELRRRGRRQVDRGRADLRRRGLLGREQVPVRAHQEQGRRQRHAGVRGVSAALCDAAAKVTALPQLKIVDPPKKRRQEGVPDLDVHVRDRPDELGRQGADAAQVRLLGRHRGTEVRPAALLRAAAHSRSTASSTARSRRSRPGP